VSAQTFTLGVRRGQSGSVVLAPSGASLPLHIGGRSVRAMTGLPLVVSGLPSRLRPHRTTTLRLRVTSLGAPVAGAEITAIGHARATAFTDQNGTARLRLAAGGPGRVMLTVTAPGTRRTRRTIIVRHQPKEK
jgi:hypothetical protein